MRKASRLFFMSLLILAFFTFTQGILAKDELIVTLKTDQTEFSTNESVLVEVTFSNSSNGALKILKWYTPFDGIEEPLFRVTRDGVPVKYIGAHYKRPEPEDKDFIILKSGKSMTQSIDLSDYYDFSVSGNYEISYDVESLNLYQKGNGQIKQTERLNSNSIGIKADGRATKRPTPPPSGELNNFSGCTTDQQSSILSARSQAQTYSSNALSYLINGTTGPRYTTWFGAYDSSRYTTVRNNFSNIKTAMDGASMTFDCGCKQRYYAYVYPNEPYTIYLCSVFWQAPLSGTDSKAGTLVHETSHFSIIAGTEDWAYGQTNAKNLAISDPNKAVDNADSHEYFAENTPFQP